MKSIQTLILALLASTAFGKDGAEVAALKTRVAALENQVEGLKPGLGEIMGVIQQHHAKLFFAGSNENWELADYEIDEIKEGLEDAVKYHDHFKDVKAPLSKLVAGVAAPLASVADALKQKSKASFISSFHGLTAACNACHQAADHGFVVIQDPKQADFSNQKYGH
jgi:hypothetical protein